MSGLLVKSTVVMRDNLAELNTRGLARRWPVLLGGAALTRAYVEQDLASLFDGEVRYARDAFEGLRLMDAFMAVKRGEAGAQLPPMRERRVRRRRAAAGHRAGADARPVRRGHRQPGGRPAVLRRPDRQGHPAGRVRGVPRRAGHVHGPVGAQARARRGRPVLRRAGRDRRPAPAADVAGPGAERGAAAGQGGLRLLPGGQRRQRPGHHRRRRHRAGAVHLPPAAPRPAPVPGRLLPPGRLRRHRRGRLPAGHRRPARSAGPPRTCSPRTPTASTWSCTGCRSS